MSLRLLFNGNFVRQLRGAIMDFKGQVLLPGGNRSDHYFTGAKGMA